MRYSENKAVWFAAIISAGSVGTYMFWFFLIKRYPLSTETSDWGAFGSFLAGTAGVSFALATVWMLAETLRLQRKELRLTREELTLTRDELARSSEAQSKQAELVNQSSITGQFHYLNQQVDECITSMLKEKYANDIRQPIMKVMLEQNRINSGLESEQAMAIAKQFAFIISFIERDENKSYRPILHDILQSLTFKHGAILKGLCDIGCMSAFREDIRERAMALAYFDDESLLSNE